LNNQQNFVHGLTIAQCFVNGPFGKTAGSISAICKAAHYYYYFIIIIIIVIFAKIKVTLSHKSCRGTVHKSLSQVGHWSNVSYTAAAAQHQIRHLVTSLKPIQTGKNDSATAKHLQ